MPDLSRNYSFESIPETHDCCTERFLRDFGPFSLKGLFQSFRIIMSSSAGFALQGGPHTKVSRVQVQR